MDNFKMRKNQLIFNVFPSLSDAKRTEKKVSSTHRFISINLYHVANISGIFRVSYKKSLLVLKMYAHSYRASNRFKLHHALVMTHAVTRYNTSRLSGRTKKNQPSYESFTAVGS
jgi:hypothetical protein